MYPPEVLTRPTLEQRRDGMCSGKDVEEINELKRQGLAIRAISRLTGYDRRTITRYLLKATGT